MRIPSGTTDRYIYFVAVDSTDLKTRETGLTTFTVYRSRNGAAAASMTTPTVNETDTTNMPGVYELLLDEDTTLAAGNDTEEMALHITQASMAPVTRVVELYRPETTEGNTLGIASDGDISGNLDGTVATVTTLTGHTAQTGDNYARIGAPAGASVSADVAAVKVDTAAVLVDTADMQPKLGAPAADIAADIAAVKVDTAATLVDTGTTLPATLAALNDVSVADILTTQMTESYNTDGAAPTLAQALHLVIAYLTERSVSGTTVTAKQLDGTTTAATFTLNDGTNPTSVTRAT